MQSTLLSAFVFAFILSLTVGVFSDSSLPFEDEAREVGGPELHMGADTTLSIDSTLALPSVFVADRIFVEHVAIDGDTLRFLTDTGGGLFLLERAVEKLDLAITDTAMVEGRPTPLITPPEFGNASPLPSIPLDEVPLFSSEGQSALLEVGDGMLGHAWFGDRVWTFDYERKEMRYHTSSAGLIENADHTVSLGFRKDEEGRRVNNFPSIEATIDGETYAFLFDTGASLVLSDSAHAKLGGPPVQGTSFISESIFEKWRSDQPEWRIIENADRFPGGMPVIEVPEVSVAGHTVGPVWFTKRPDRNFHEYMSGMMDRHVEGALGGSLFRYFVITADYPGARAAFERVE